MIVAPFISKSSGGLFEFIQKVAGLFSVPIAIIVLVGISKKTSALAEKFLWASLLLFMDTHNLSAP